MMAHFAEIDLTNTVIRVIALDDEFELNGSEWCNRYLGGRWIQTSYNGNIRKQYAGIGYTYDAVADVFIAPQPYPSWSLDSNYDWQAPVQRPADGKHYLWDESNQAWVLVG